MNIIEYKNVSKHIYGFSLKNINIEMKEGEILGIVGATGAGKTTLVKLLLNYYHPNKGSVMVGSLNANRDSTEIKKFLGTIPQHSWFPANRRPVSLLKESMRLRDISNKEEMDYLIDYFELNTRQKINDMSELDKRKLAIINGLVFNPSLIVVDEPGTILDVSTRIKLYDILEEKNREGVSILILTNNLKEAQSICDTIYFLHEGTIIEKEDQSNKFSNDKILKYYDKNIDRDIFTSIGGKLVQDGNETIVYYNNDLNLLAEAIYKSGLKDYSIENSTLEDKLKILEREYKITGKEGV